MAKDYLMPKLAMAMNEGTVNAWLVADGAHVREGDDIVTVETEKVAYDLQSPETGYLEILVPVGETVPVEAVIGRFHDSPPAADDSAGPPEKESGERVKASPVVRKLARELGIDLATVEGSGPGGRIVKRDLDAVEDASQKGAKEEPPAPAAVRGVSEQPAARAVEAAPDDDDAVLTRFSIRGTTRAVIARRMQASLAGSAQLSSSWESDLTRLLEARQSFLDREQELGTRISVNAFLIKAMVHAIRQVPIANASLAGDEIVIYRRVNVGIAVAMPGRNEYDSSLLVPVLKRVDTMGLAEIDRQMKALIAATRDGTAGADDMVGSTITLSSTAGVGPPGATNTPILNSPNAVILGPSTPVDRVMPVDGEARIRRMLPLSMTFDHRILDGEPAARFMGHLHEAIEQPMLMLI